jgi:hypothetical protein
MQYNVLLWFDYEKYAIPRFWTLYVIEIDDVERKKSQFFVSEVLMISTSSDKTWRHWRPFFAAVTSSVYHGPGTALDMISFYAWRSRSQILRFDNAFQQVKLICRNYDPGIE